MRGNEDRYDDIPDGWEGHKELEERKDHDSDIQKAIEISKRDMFEQQEREKRAQTMKMKAQPPKGDDFNWESQSKPLDTPGFQAEGNFDFDFEKSNSTPIDQPSSGIDGLADVFGTSQPSAAGTPQPQAMMGASDPLADVFSTTPQPQASKPDPLGDAFSNSGYSQNNPFANQFGQVPPPQPPVAGQQQPQAQSNDAFDMFN